MRDGALFALLGALWVPSIEKVAGYEPLLFLDQPGLDNFLGFMRQFDQQLAEAGWAMPSSPRSKAQVRENHGPGFRGSADAVPELRDASRGNAGQGRRRAAERSPPPTIHHEIELVKRTEGTLDNYRGVAAEVLLLYGSDTDSVFKVTAEALQSVLPHSICIELPDLDHRSVQNYGKSERI